MKRRASRPEQLLSVSPRQRELNAVNGVALATEEQDEVKAEEIKRRLF